MTDRLFGIVAGVLSLLFLLVAVPSIAGDWQSGPDARYFTVGPRLFPYIAGGLTLIFSIGIALRAAPDSRLKLFNSFEGRINVLMALAIALLFVVLLNVLGFVVSGVLALIAFLIGFGERRWYVVLPLGVGVPVFVKLVFTHAFALELPSGLIELPI